MDMMDNDPSVGRTPELQRIALLILNSPTAIELFDKHSNLIGLKLGKRRGEWVIQATVRNKGEIPVGETLLPASLNADDIILKVDVVEGERIIDLVFR